MVLRSRADFKRSWLAASLSLSPSVALSLSDINRRFLAANSGLTPPERFSIQDHARAFLDAQGIVQGSLNTRFKIWADTRNGSTQGASKALKDTYENVPFNATVTAHLPFNMNYTGLNASAKKVFGHAFPPRPVSVNNLALTEPTEYYRNRWLPPGSLEGATDHSLYGGFVRDRPSQNRGASYTPLAGNYTSVYTGTPSLPLFHRRNWVEEINNAIEAGLDGFFVDYISNSGNNHDWTLALLEAALVVNNPNFKIAVMLDGNGSLVGLQTATFVADRLKALYDAYSSVMYIKDGNLVLPIYRPEGKTATYFSDVQTRLNAVALNHEFWMCYEDSWIAAAQAPAFNSLAAVHGRWGDPDYVTAGASNISNRGAAAHCTATYSKPWLHPVRPQDNRPYTQGYWEAKNTQLLRTSWDVVINNGASFVQLTTWSDLTEGSHFAPSMNSGFALLDINAYYLSWWKLGAPPSVIRDTLYLTHRIHNTALASFTGTQSQFMTKLGSSGVVNEVEVVAFLQDGAVVTITDDGVDTNFPGAAGLNVFTIPLTMGAISAKATRGSTVVASVTSTQPPSATQLVQDLHYRHFSSMAGR